MLTSLPHCEVTVREPTSSSGDEHDVLLEPSSGDGVIHSDVLLYAIIGNVVSILREIAAICRHETTLTGKPNHPERAITQRFIGM